jgi:hypothetical protein
VKHRCCGRSIHACTFRYGTVIRPLLKDEYYDLDLVCQLQVTKSGITQKALKDLVGEEVKSYAEAHNFNEPAEPKRRCWRLNYADHASFHLDILPAAPEGQDVIELLVESGVEAQYATSAVGITDVDSPFFVVLNPNWPPSNPDGIGDWFVDQMRPASMGRRRALVEATLYASVDDVPVYDWKTPLQRSIQLLKRHRDVMFRNKPELKPISMIITTLAALAYGGEVDIHNALSGILERMPQFVSTSPPHVGNPVNPAEDFAERWWKDPKGAQLKDSFWAWRQRAVADFAALSSLSGSQLEGMIRRSFDVRYSSQSVVGAGTVGSVVPAIHIVREPVRIVTPPKPWAT